MNRSQQYQTDRQFNRSQDVPVSTEFTSQLERIALAHAASGNMSEFQLIFNTISKTDPKIELETVISRLDRIEGVEGV